MRFAKNILLLSGLGCASLCATVITPTSAGTPVTVGATTVGSLGTLTFLQAITATFSIHQAGKSGGTLSGNLTTAVYRTGGGTLDFFYQITEDKANTKAISDLGAPIQDTFGASGGVNIYYLPVVTGLTGSAGFVSSTKGATPHLTASWTAGNNSISWLPQGMGTTNSVSTVFVMTTQATSYSTDLASLQGGNLVAPSLGTASPTPEPGFYGVLGVGLSGLAFVAVRRRRVQQG
jgi:hypothetical protein